MEKPTKKENAETLKERIAEAFKEVAEIFRRLAGAPKKIREYAPWFQPAEPDLACLSALLHYYRIEFRLQKRRPGKRREISPEHESLQNELKALKRLQRILDRRRETWPDEVRLALNNAGRRAPGDAPADDPLLARYMPDHKFDLAVESRGAYLKQILRRAGVTRDHSLGMVTLHTTTRAFTATFPPTQRGPRYPSCLAFVVWVMDKALQEIAERQGARAKNRVSTATQGARAKNRVSTATQRAGVIVDLIRAGVPGDEPRLRETGPDRRTLQPTASRETIRAWIAQAPKRIEDVTDREKEDGALRDFAELARDLARAL